MAPLKSTISMLLKLGYLASQKVVATSMASINANVPDERCPPPTTLITNVEDKLPVISAFRYVHDAIAQDDYKKGKALVLYTLFGAWFCYKHKPELFPLVKKTVREKKAEHIREVIQKVKRSDAVSIENYPLAEAIMKGVGNLSKEAEDVMYAIGAVFAASRFVEKVFKTRSTIVEPTVDDLGKAYDKAMEKYEEIEVAPIENSIDYRLGKESITGYVAIPQGIKARDLIVVVEGGRHLIITSRVHSFHVISDLPPCVSIVPNNVKASVCNDGSLEIRLKRIFRNLGSPKKRADGGTFSVKVKDFDPKKEKKKVDKKEDASSSLVKEDE